MPIKSILCPYNGFAFENPARDTALKLAVQFAAEVVFLHATVPIDRYPELYGVALYGQAVAGSSDIFDSMAHDRGAMRDKALESITSAAADHEMSFCLQDGSDLPYTGLGAVFWEVVATIDECLPAAARSTDLIVIGRDRAGAGMDFETLLVSLFKGGRPVLIVPNMATPAPSEAVVAVAWDGSLAASRAVHDALPFLLSASRVEIICVRSRKPAADTANFDKIAHWMALHGITAHICRTERTQASVGRSILAHAHAAGAGLLIMGAYGHSHVAEMLLGGVSDYLLKNSDMMLLVSH
jgi:nucleotide-binding universal stress UspA family protein